MGVVGGVKPLVVVCGVGVEASKQDARRHLHEHCSSCVACSPFWTLSYATHTASDDQKPHHDKLDDN